MTVKNSQDFYAWIGQVFDHPSCGPEWDDAAGPCPSTAAEYLAQLFEAPCALLGRFSEKQIALGLERLLSNANSNYVFVLADESVPQELQLRVVSSLYTLFKDLLARICSENVGVDHPHRRPADSICFMMWDAGLLQIYPERPEHRIVDMAILNVLGRILALPSQACKKSALHGLGHAHFSYPEEIPPIIDAFLADHPDLNEDLREYALAARVGGVL
jgi:hypothetical protein